MQYLQQSRANLLHTSFGFTTSPYHPPPNSHHSTPPCLAGCCDGAYTSLARTFQSFYFNVWSLRSNFCLGPLPKPLGGEEKKWAEKRLTAPLFCVFESYTLSAFIHFIALLLGMLLFCFYIYLSLFLVLVSVSKCVKPLWSRACWPVWVGLPRHQVHGGVADASALGRRRRRWVEGG